MTRTLWNLPVPSTALLVSPVLDVRGGREIGIKMLQEVGEGSRELVLVFAGVEAFKVTYYQSNAVSVLDAYDRLVDREGSAWLDEVRENLARNLAKADGLSHLGIYFDDGPYSEFICRAFRVDIGDDSHA
jgi:hypothetical protein